MDRDIHTLIETTNNDIFEEQATNWPGIEVCRKFLWNCVCGEKECFRKCMQTYAKMFPSPDVYVEWLTGIVLCQNLEDVLDYTAVFAEVKNIDPNLLLGEEVESEDTWLL